MRRTTSEMATVTISEQQDASHCDHRVNGPDDAYQAPQQHHGEPYRHAAKALHSLLVPHPPHDEGKKSRESALLGEVTAPASRLASCISPSPKMKTGVKPTQATNNAAQTIHCPQKDGATSNLRAADKLKTPCLALDPATSG